MILHSDAAEYRTVSGTNQLFMLCETVAAVISFKDKYISLHESRTAMSCGSRVRSTARNVAKNELSGALDDVIFENSLSAASDVSVVE